MTVYLDCEKNFISRNGGPTRQEDWFLFGVGEKWPTHCQTRSFLASVPGCLLKIFIWRESLGSVQGLFTAKPGQWVCSMLLGQCAIPVWVCSHWFTHSSVVLNFMYVCTWKLNWVVVRLHAYQQIWLSLCCANACSTDIQSMLPSQTSLHGLA